MYYSKDILLVNISHAHMLRMGLVYNRNFRTKGSVVYEAVLWSIQMFVMQSNFCICMARQIHDEMFAVYKDGCLPYDTF